MIRTPQPGTFRPARDILEIVDFIGDPVTGADFPEAKLRFRNDRWAESVGLSGLSDEEWIAMERHATDEAYFTEFAARFPRPQGK